MLRRNWTGFSIPHKWVGHQHRWRILSTLVHARRRSETRRLEHAHVMRGKHSSMLHTRMYYGYGAYSDARACRSVLVSTASNTMVALTDMELFVNNWRLPPTSAISRKTSVEAWQMLYVTVTCNGGFVDTFLRHAAMKAGAACSCRCSRVLIGQSIWYSTKRWRCELDRLVVRS